MLKKKTQWTCRHLNSYFQSRKDSSIFKIFIQITVVLKCLCAILVQFGAITKLLNCSENREFSKIQRWSLSVTILLQQLRNKGDQRNYLQRKYLVISEEVCCWVSFHHCLCCSREFTQLPSFKSHLQLFHGHHFPSHLNGPGYPELYPLLNSEERHAFRDTFKDTTEYFYSRNFKKFSGLLVCLKSLWLV